MNENDELITAGEAADVLDAVTELPVNKCITRGEFDDLVASNIKYTLIVNPTPSNATVKINSIETKTFKVLPNASAFVEVSKPGFENYNGYIQVTQEIQLLNIVLNLSSSGGVYRPNDAPEGVYILSTDGYVYESSYWETSNNSDAVGVAVKTSACSFVIAPNEINAVQWGGNGTIIPGCTNTSSQSTAQTDYNGKANTDAIVAQFGVPSRNNRYAAYYCLNYSFKNGAKGYLGAAGEWYQAYQNKSQINACMSLIGGDPLSDAVGIYFKWSSTQYLNDNAWGLIWAKGTITYYNKLSNYSEITTRAFSAFPA